MFGGRINLCRNRIFFCHIYLHWSKSFAGSALLIEKSKKRPFPRPCRSLLIVYPHNHPKVKAKFLSRTLECDQIFRQGYANTFSRYLTVAEQLTPLWHLHRNDPASCLARRRKNKAKVTKHKIPADICVPKLRSNSAHPLSSIKTCHYQAQLIEKCTPNFPNIPIIPKGRRVTLACHLCPATQRPWLAPSLSHARRRPPTRPLQLAGCLLEPDVVDHSRQ